MSPAFEMSIDEIVRRYVELDAAYKAVKREQLSREVMLGWLLMQAKPRLGTNYGRFLSEYGLNLKTAQRRVKLAQKYATPLGGVDEAKLTSAVAAWNAKANTPQDVIATGTITLRQAELAAGIRTVRNPDNAGPMGPVTQRIPEICGPNGSTTDHVSAHDDCVQTPEDAELDALFSGMSDADMMRVHQAGEARRNDGLSSDDAAAAIDALGFEYVAARCPLLAAKLAPKGTVGTKPANVVEFKAVPVAHPSSDETVQRIMAMEHASERRATQGNRGSKVNEAAGSESRGTRPVQLGLDAVYAAIDAEREARERADRIRTERQAEYLAIVARHTAEWRAFADGGAA